MAKTTFASLKLKRVDEVKKITFNDAEIEVKQYLPVSEKLELVAAVINNSADINNFANPIKIDVFTTLEIIYRYTNLVFTDKQKEDPAKLFDTLETTGFIAAVLAVIPEIEYNFILDSVDETIRAFYRHRNSVLGILEQVSADYANMSLDASQIQKKLADPENITLLKNIMEKLG